MIKADIDLHSKKIRKLKKPLFSCKTNQLCLNSKNLEDTVDTKTLERSEQTEKKSTFVCSQLITLDDSQQDTNFTVEASQKDLTNIINQVQSLEKQKPFRSGSKDDEFYQYYRELLETQSIGEIQRESVAKEFKAIMDNYLHIIRVMFRYRQI